MYTRIFKIIVPIVTVIICVILAEVILSFFYTGNESYYVWKPHWEYTFGLDNTVLRGVSNKPYSLYNSLGIRSDEFNPKENYYKILAFGGSTTECQALDQEKTWTQILQQILNKDNSKDSYWVGNLGKSGSNSNHHVLQTTEMLKKEELQDVKLVMYLVGFNDLIRSLKVGDEYINYDLKKLQRRSFKVVPDEDLPFVRRTALWKFLKDVKYRLLLNKYDNEDLVQLYKDIRKTRKEAEKTSIVPNLDSSIAHYKKNIDSLISICKTNGKEPIFITQPVLWRPGITKESLDQLIIYFKESANLEAETLYECMELFNHALIEVCEARGVDYIDLFPISKEKWFYDDCHFNEHGANEVAHEISKYFITRFNKATPVPD